MVTKTGYSIKERVGENVKDIAGQFGPIKANMVLFFASSKFDTDKLGKAFQKSFPKSKVFGCSTAGELVSGRMLKNSVVAMAFDEKAVSDVELSVVERIKEENNVKTALAPLEKHFKQKIGDMDVEKYVGIVLIDGMSGSEEKIMDTLGDLTNLIFIGGSAGDDLKFKSTSLFADGKAYTNAAVLAVLKPTLGYEIIKTQSFKSLAKKLVADKVDEANREVVNFNKMPAVDAYAKAVGTTKDNVQSFFMKNPVGLMIDGEPYVRSPQQAKGSSLAFYCNIKEGMELSLLESTDIVKDTREAVSKNGDAAALINFHCILRTLELEQKKQTEAYGKIFSKVPTIGFSTYGEEYLGHINQTSTMLLLK